MNQSERDAVGQALVKAVLFYDRPDIDRAKISGMIGVFFEAFPEATADKILQALAEYRADPKNTTFPAPARLQPYLRPVASDDAKAVESVNRILGAVSKYGYNRGVEARAHIGELGWSVVKDYGGWEMFCQNMGVELNEQTFRAQAREQIKAKLNLQRAGLLDRPIGITGSQAQALLAPVKESAETFRELAPPEGFEMPKAKEIPK